MKVIKELKHIIYKFCSSLFEKIHASGNKHESITQEEAEALYDLIDSYMNDDSGK